MQVKIKGRVCNYEPNYTPNSAEWKWQAGPAFRLDTISGVEVFIKRFKSTPPGEPLLQNLMSNHSPFLPEVYDYVHTTENNQTIRYLFTEALKGDLLDNLLKKGGVPDALLLCADLLSALESIHSAGFWMSDLCEKNVFVSGGRFFLIDLDSCEPLIVRPTPILNEPGYVPGQEFAALAMEFYRMVLGVAAPRFEDFDGQTLNYLQTALLCAKVYFYAVEKEKNASFSYRDKTLRDTLHLRTDAHTPYARSLFTVAQKAKITPDAVKTLVRELKAPKPTPKPEPIAQPTPKPTPKPEPVAQPVPKPKPEPVAQPAPKPEPVAQPVPSSIPTPAPLSEAPQEQLTSQTANKRSLHSLLFFISFLSITFGVQYIYRVY